MGSWSIYGGVWRGEGGKSGEGRGVRELGSWRVLNIEELVGLWCVVRVWRVGWVEGGDGELGSLRRPHPHAPHITGYPTPQLPPINLHIPQIGIIFLKQIHCDSL